MKSIFSIAIALVLGFCSLSAYSQDLKTQMKVSKGQEFNQQVDILMDITQTMGTQEMKINNNVSSTSKFVINNAPKKGNIEITGTIWDVKTTTKAPMMDTTVSLPGKVGPTMKIELNQYGKLVSKIKTDSAALNGVNLDNNLVSSGIFVEFPEKEVLKVGEKWTIAKNDTVSQMGGKIGMNFSTEYTLGGVEKIDGKSLQKITTSSNIEMGGKANQMGMDIFIEGTGAGTGTLYIDPVSKVIYTNNTVIELNLDLAVTGQQNMTIPMTQKITVNQKLK